MWNPRCSHATFFSLKLNNQQMQAELYQSDDKPLAATETSFQKLSLNTTQIHSHYSPHSLEQQFNSQQTFAETLPFNSRAMDFEDTPATTRLQQQLTALQQRFKGIHKILIDHSQWQSELHEKKRGYKLMPIDPACLPRDFSNKVHLIGDITSLVDKILKDQNIEYTELLQTKFQEYYLQRHYGGLTCDFDNLSIQQRLQNSMLKQNTSSFKDESSSVSGVNSRLRQADDQNMIISKIGNFQSLIPQSKITYSEQFCQTQEIDLNIAISVPRIIEVEVPVIIYKIKEMVIKYEESDLFHNIDDIITKYSKPYEDIYQNNKENQDSSGEIPATIPHTPVQSKGPVSSLSQNMESHQITEIELAYSDFPEEDHLKLPLDSYAQIESLISNSSRPGTDRSRPPTDRETPVSNDLIYITEKVVSRSIIEKYEESQRALIEENAELKEWIENLRVQIYESEKKHKDLEITNKKLAQRLQEQIQQTEYYSSKLDDLNAELLQQKVLCLTHLNESKDRKLDMLNNDLAAKTEELMEMNRHILNLEHTIRMNEDILQKKEDEIATITKVLQEKEQQLNELNSCEEHVIQIASETEIALKEQIQKLEKERGELKDNLKFYRQRLESEGISLQLEEATEIQGFIEQREHNFSLQLQEVSKKYDEVLGVYQKELTELKTQLQELRILNECKSRQIQSHIELQTQKKHQTQQYFKQFQQIIDEYHTQLQQKDQQILALKSNAVPQLSCDVDVQLLLERTQHSIEVIQAQLQMQRQHKSQLTVKLVELDRTIRQEIQNSRTQKDRMDEERLIEQLSLQLEKKIKENCWLKQQSEKLINKLTQTSKGNGNQLLGEAKQENVKLRKVNSNLKRYTLALQEEIRAVCGIDECQSHRSEIDRLIQQRDFYLNLATQNQGDPLFIPC